MKNLRSGFTLVELIVVITILAILGTIAFISLQGYSADARNSKRTADLNSIQSSMSTKSTEGVALLNFVTQVSGNLVASVSIGGATATAGTDYNAGTLNFTALGMKAADFKDPNNKDYVIGATSKLQGKYELAATMEVGGGNKQSLVTWSFAAVRTTAPTVTGVTGTGTTVLTTPSSAIGKFAVGDTISWGGSAIVLDVSWDGTQLTVSNTTITTSSIALAANETKGLIQATVTSNTIDADSTVQNNDSDLAYTY